MALDKVTMTGATKYTVKQGFTAVNQIIDDLASNETDQGASCIGIEDAAGNFAATTVEDALAEICDDIGSMQTISGTFDEDTATTTGLTWGYKGGLLRTTSTVTTIADGTVSLTDDTTNYIEIGTDGTVYAVASAFTDGRLPIRTVVCASGVQTTSTDYRAYFTSVALSTFMAGMLNDEDAAAALTTLGVSAFAKTLLDDADAAAARATLGATEGLPLYLSGLAIAHAADTEHDITVAVGFARDDTDAENMVLASAITKQFDAEWSVGSAAGGFASGETLPASGTIHIWLIKRADTGVVDVFANDHATSGLTPTLPTDYDYKRRIFSLRTDASNNIINGDQWGTGLNRIFMYDTPILDINNATSGTNAVTAALSTPGGIACIARLNIFTNVSTNGVYLSALDNTDLAPSVSAAPLAHESHSHTYSGTGGIEVKTNTSSQIRYRCLQNDKCLIATLGWEDAL